MFLEEICCCEGQKEDLLWLKKKVERAKEFWRNWQIICIPQIIIKFLLHVLVFFCHPRNPDTKCQPLWMLVIFSNWVRRWPRWPEALGDELPSRWVCNRLWPLWPLTSRLNNKILTTTQHHLRVAARQQGQGNFLKTINQKKMLRRTR